MKSFLWSRFAPTVLSLSLVAVSSARAGQEALAPAPATERPTVYLEQGDGLTINAAIRQLPEGGGVIVLGPNLFPVSEAIVIDRDGVELRGIGRETILRDGVAVGYLTSGGYGYTVGHSIGFGYIRHAAGVNADWLAAGHYALVIAGAETPARIAMQSLYDPTGARVKS